MISSNKETAPVKAVLRVAMIVEGEAKEKGEIVLMKARDFHYLSNHDRVAQATPENVAAVKAEVKAEKEAAEKAANKASEVEELKAQLAAVQAENAVFKGKK